MAKPGTAAMAHVYTSLLPAQADWHSCLSVFLFSPWMLGAA